MVALVATSVPHLLRGNYAAVNAQADELVALAEEKGACSGRRPERESRLRGGPNRQRLEGNPPDHLRDNRKANGSNNVVAEGYPFWREPMRNSANSMTLGAALAKR